VAVGDGPGGRAGGGAVKKISTRFALLMAAAAVLPLLAYGAASIYSMRQTARAQVFDANSSVALRAAAEIDRYVETTIRLLEGIATNLADNRLLPWQKERLLRNMALRNPEFTELTLIDANGEPLVTSRIGRPSLTGVPREAVDVRGIRMSPFMIDEALLPTAILGIRVDEGDQEQWLVASVSLEELWRMVNEIRIGDRGFALVVTDQGQLLAHGEPESKSLVARRPDMSAHPLLASRAASGGNDNTQPARAEYEDWSAAQLDRDRGRIVGVSVTMRTLPWNVLVEQPSNEAFAGPIRTQKLLMAAIATALMIMLTVGWFFGRSFINPILRLTRGTAALAEGRLNERVVVDSKDELGQLGTAFNNMADRLVELQEDVVKKERQATFGRVAVGLVHDLSNPIQNLGNACKMMVMLFDDLEYRTIFKRTSERELAQVKRMLDDLRNIAKPVPLERFPLDVNKAVGEVVESMQASAEAAGLTLTSELVFGPMFIKGDLFALNRVYGNLITNAMQATTSPGRITVRTRREDEHAVIEFVDTGSGIPGDRLDTIFDDFVTTKKRGLGLGLAMAKKVVEQLDGTIAVTSEVGTGTTFTLRFPLTKARPEQLAS
jgi:two-component system NtrC family sensor kinase